MPPPEINIITVWIIEDVKGYRQTICYVLNNTTGIECPKEFSTCEAALDWIKSEPTMEPPDVILLDIRLPGMSGIEGVGSLKALLPTTSIVMLTILDDAKTIYDALHAGASGYLVKESPLDQIMAAIRAAHQGGMLMPPEVASKVLSFFKGTKTDYGLTEREKEVLREMGEGYTQKEIAARLFISPYTVNTHIQNIYKKLHVNSAIEAVERAIRERLITSQHSDRP